MKPCQPARYSLRLPRCSPSIRHHECGQEHFQSAHQPGQWRQGPGAKKRSERSPETFLGSHPTFSIAPVGLPKCRRGDRPAGGAGTGKIRPGPKKLRLMDEPLPARSMRSSASRMSEELRRTLHEPDGRQRTVYVTHLISWKPLRRWRDKIVVIEPLVCCPGSSGRPRTKIYDCHRPMFEVASFLGSPSIELSQSL